jgi:excisionase family DNA binding protein
MSSPVSLAPRSDLFTREQAAAYLGVSPRTLAVWKCTGRYDLPVVKLGLRIVRYRKSDLDAFITRGASNAKASIPARWEST